MRVRGYSLILVFIAAVAVVSASGCGGGGNKGAGDATATAPGEDGADPGDGAATEQPTLTAAQVEAAKTIFVALGVVTTYQSLDEAEAVAGYRIPRPAPRYPIFRLPALRVQGTAPPISETTYSLPSGRTVSVTVLPSGLPRAPGSVAVTLGGRSGWAVAGRKNDVYFDCGAGTPQPVCHVFAPEDVAAEEFAAFLATLQ